MTAFEGIKSSSLVGTNDYGSFVTHTLIPWVARLR